MFDGASTREMNRANIRSTQQYGEAHLRKLRGRYVGGITFSTAMMGLLAYGCQQLQGSLQEWLTCLTLPLLMLILYVVSYVLTDRRIQRLSENEEA